MLHGRGTPGLDGRIGSAGRTLDPVTPGPVLLAWLITEYEQKNTSRSPRPERLGRSSVVVPGLKLKLPEDFDRRPAGCPA
jgi:hypothetical protein